MWPHEKWTEERWEEFREQGDAKLQKVYDDIKDWEAQNQKPSRPAKLGHGILKLLTKFAQTYAGDGNIPPTTYF